MMTGANPACPLSARIEAWQRAQSIGQPTSSVVIEPLVSLPDNPGAVATLPPPINPIKEVLLPRRKTTVSHPGAATRKPCRYKSTSKSTTKKTTRKNTVFNSEEASLNRMEEWARRLDQTCPKGSELFLTQKAVKIFHADWLKYELLPDHVCRNWLRELRQIRGPLCVRTEGYKKEKIEDIRLKPVSSLPLGQVRYILSDRLKAPAPPKARLHVCFHAPQNLQEAVMCNSLVSLMRTDRHITDVTFEPFRQWHRRPDEFSFGLSSKDNGNLESLSARCTTRWGSLLTQESHAWDWAGSGQCLGPGLFASHCSPDQNPALDHIQQNAKVVAKAVIKRRRTGVALRDCLAEMIRKTSDTCQELSSVTQARKTADQVVSDADNDLTLPPITSGKPQWH